MLSLKSNLRVVLGEETVELVLREESSVGTPLSLWLELCARVSLGMPSCLNYLVIMTSIFILSVEPSLMKTLSLAIPGNDELTDLRLVLLSWAW
jgi:hypothetical protein